MHSAGSAAFMGNTTHSLALERELGDFIGLEHVLLYPTGYAAGAGVIRGLVRAKDHVIIDALAHACLQDGAAAATKNVYLSRHLELASVTRWLTHIRSKDRENAILVVTEGLFSMDSDTPDIKAIAAVCREYGATLMVDVAHDFGCLGDGRGHIGLQDATADVDIVIGQLLEDLRIQRRVRGLPCPRREGISALFLDARHVLERALADPGGPSCSRR